MKEQIKKIVFNKYFYFILALILFWIKSYAAFKIFFQPDLENDTQGFILLITPISTALVFFGLSLFFKGPAHRVAVLVIDFVLSFILTANIIYHRFFDDYITIPDLMQFKNFGELGGSAKVLAEPIDILYWADFIILVILALVLKKAGSGSFKFKKRFAVGIIAAGIAVFFVNLTLAEEQRSDLLTRTFDRAKLVKLLGLYNYHIYDAVINIRTSSQRAIADSSDINGIKNYVKANHVKPSDKFFGAAKGKNVILVSLESTQSFLINYKLHGQEVTPFLNDLVSKSFYFDNFYHNTGQGKTSDAEFLIDNSIYPLPRGAVYTTNAQNEYHATPEILDQHGYTSVAFHGNHKSFWNRDIMYKTLGYDKFYPEKYFNITEDNSINYGLKDIPFFKQAVPILKKVQQPFYAKFITLSNHFPFVLDPEDEMIEPANTEDNVVNRYFQTARYEDEALRIFFEKLKESDLYKNSVIVLYGDHYGISENHNEAMAKVIGVDEINSYHHLKLQRVPLFIHIPGMEDQAKVMHTTSGEIDVKPTILHLLGIQTKDDIAFGADLFSPERPSFTIQRDGSFISGKYIYSKKDSTCYLQKTGDVVGNKQCKPLENKALHELQLSDKVIYGDLLRFTDR
ncbi:lipoteichoic acid synthase [Scopulibacillus darangshiensis]|uniref:Lipoteichoic acid synthase n=1 Tax=Scopulibacillus darangshiensis TaxID=442528 RepID=A0A4V2SMF4_9BACL|nr:LTA synthase family protein [Scopulibacillus darangshiensis]TCP27076.1 lipoteichoic acid synthase [Scopulibacillus darangshiensis]